MCIHGLYVKYYGVVRRALRLYYHYKLEFVQRILDALLHAMFSENIEEDGLSLVLVPFELLEELTGFRVWVWAV